MAWNNKMESQKHGSILKLKYDRFHKTYTYRVKHKKLKSDFKKEKCVTQLNEIKYVVVNKWKIMDALKGNKCWHLPTLCLEINYKNYNTLI